MKLIIMRHASANTSAEEGDAGRVLDANGIVEAERQGKWLARAHKEFVAASSVMSSPYARAQQTASQIALATSFSAGKIIVDAATPDGSPEECAAFLNEQSHKKIILCSHMPFVGLFAAYLLGEPRHRARSFSTAMMLCLEADVWGAGMASELWVKEA